VIKDFFHPSPRLGNLIFQTIHKLKVQRVKLEQVTVRLRERDRVLFETCAFAIGKKNKERAAICANELVEVRKLLNTVVRSQLAIERIILRLETIRELSDVIVDLKPALSTLQDVAKHLVRVMPEIASELEKVNDSISETLAMTSVDSPQPVTPYEVKTPDSEEVLKEVSTFLEQRLTEKLPEPPASVLVPEKAEPAKNVRQMIALTASCSEVCEQGEPKARLSYRDVELQSVSLTIQRSSSLEDTLLEYAKRYKGEIDVDRCALELNVPSKDVKRALENLGAKGKIEIRR